MSTAVLETGDNQLTGKINFGIIGFGYAIAVYQLSAFLVDAIIVATEAQRLMAASMLIQVIVGVMLSLAAYSVVTDRSVKMGMRACYGSVCSVLFVLGSFTIFTSLLGQF